MVGRSGRASERIRSGRELPDRISPARLPASSSEIAASTAPRSRSPSAASPKRERSSAATLARTTSSSPASAAPSSPSVSAGRRGRRPRVSAETKRSRSAPSGSARRRTAARCRARTREKVRGRRTRSPSPSTPPRTANGARPRALERSARKTQERLGDHADRRLVAARPGPQAQVARELVQPLREPLPALSVGDGERELAPVGRRRVEALPAHSAGAVVRRDLDPGVAVARRDDPALAVALGREEPRRGPARGSPASAA